VYKFGELIPIISEFTLVKRAIFAETRQEFDDRSSLGTLAFRNVLEDRNYEFRAVIGNHFCKSCRNLVKFGSVTPEFTTQEFVQLEKFFWGDRYVH